MAEEVSVGFNIKSFKDNVYDYGVAPANKYDVTIGLPPELQGVTMINGSGQRFNASDATSLLSFRAETAIIPPETVLTMDSYLHGIGPSTKMPYNSKIDDVTFRFIADSRGNAQTFWHTWINLVSNVSGNDNAVGAIGGLNLPPSYCVRYFDNISSKVTIVVYTSSSELIMIHNFYNAYPTSMGETRMSWGSKNTVTMIGISMTYREHTVERLGIGVNQQP
jgi:hypothetical protein